MKHYEEGAALAALLTDLVDRHPIHPETAVGWFEIAHKLLEITIVIRRDAWRVMPTEAKQHLIRNDDALRHVDEIIAVASSAAD